MYYYEGDFVDGYKVFYDYIIFSMESEDCMNLMVVTIIACG